MTKEQAERVWQAIVYCVHALKYADHSHTTPAKESLIAALSPEPECTCHLGPGINIHCPIHGRQAEPAGEWQDVRDWEQIRTGDVLCLNSSQCIYIVLDRDEKVIKTRDRHINVIGVNRDREREWQFRRPEKVEPEIPKMDWPTLDAQTPTARSGVFYTKEISPTPPDAEELFAEAKRGDGLWMVFAEGEAIDDYSDGENAKGVAERINMAHSTALARAEAEMERKVREEIKELVKENRGKTLPELFNKIDSLPSLAGWELKPQNAPENLSGLR